MSERGLAEDAGGADERVRRRRRRLRRRAEDARGADGGDDAQTVYTEVVMRGRERGRRCPDGVCRVERSGVRGDFRGGRVREEWRFAEGKKRMKYVWELTVPPLFSLIDI